MKCYPRWIKSLLLLLLLLSTLFSCFLLCLRLPCLLFSSPLLSLFYSVSFCFSLFRFPSLHVALQRDLSLNEIKLCVYNTGCSTCHSPQLAHCEERLVLMEQSLSSTQEQLSARVSEVRTDLFSTRYQASACETRSVSCRFCGLLLIASLVFM